MIIFVPDAAEALAAAQVVDGDVVALNKQAISPKMGMRDLNAGVTEGVCKCVKMWAKRLLVREMLQHLKKE